MMRTVDKKWLALFDQATKEKTATFSLVEEGYYLFVQPNYADMNNWQRVRAETEYRLLRGNSCNFEEGVTLTLNEQQQFDLGPEYDYHLWAQPFANKIDSSEIIARVVINLATFLNILNQFGKAQGFAIWRDAADEKYLELICHRFRLPVNLYREIARTVFSAKLLEEEIQDLLGEAQQNCYLLHGYAQQFFGIFSNYRTFVGDHHFVAARGEKELAPGFDYWSLLANPDKMEQTFWRGIEAVKKILVFAEAETKTVN